MESRALPGAHAPYEVASRASNLAEQIRIVEALPPRDRRADGALSGVAAWRLQRLARRLAHRSAERAPDSDGGGGPWAPPSPEELERILRANRLLQLRSGQLGPADRRVLEEMHAAWLPTYAAALEGF